MSDPMTSPWEAQRAAMGAFIRSQRELANMSLRELSRATKVSNAYLSQIERGLHDPTLRVLLQIGDALHLSVDDLLREGGRARADADDLVGRTTDDDDPDGPRRTGVHEAVLADPDLTDAEKDALLGVYRSFKAARPS